MEHGESPMSGHELAAWEQEVQKRAQRFIYPPTPDIARRLEMGILAAGALPVTLAGPSSTPSSTPPSTLRRSTGRRRLAWGLALLLVLAAALLTAEPVRAWVIEVLRLGAVRIFLQPPNELVPPPTALPSIGDSAASASGSLDWMGETTLADAAVRLPFAIQLPSWPADLGVPDHVYVQELAGMALMSVWLDPQQAGRVRLSLHALASDAIVHKFAPVTVTETQVNGQPALWTEGPYLVRVGRGDIEPRRLITGHVLIWNHDDTTYRLETDLSLEEAIRVAESLRPWQQDH